MRVLITGATGFIGSAVLRKLLNRGVKCRALVRLHADRRNLEGLDVDVTTGDLLNPGTLDEAARGCDGLYHIAADYRLWARDPDRLMATNVDGTRQMLLAAARAGIKRIVYTSSVASIKPNDDGSPTDETAPTSLSDMIGPYKRSKFLAEAVIHELIDEHHLDVVIVNPTAPFGPRDIKPTPTGRLVVEAATGHMPAFLDTGLNIVHVDDVAEGHLLAFEKGKCGERYILGGDNLFLKDILEQIAALVGRPAPTIRLSPGLVMPIACVTEAIAKIGLIKAPFVTMDSVRMARKYMFFSSEKAHTRLGYRSRPAREALADAVSWYQENSYIRRSGGSLPLRPHFISRTHPH